MVDPSRRIEELRRELATNPTSRQFYQLGELLRRDSRVSEAAEVLRSGLAHYPRYVAAWVALGRACVDGGASEEAVTALREALALDAANPVAWRLLGEAHLALGDRRAALEVMQRCLELVPGDPVLIAAVEALAAETQPPAHPLAMTPPAVATKAAPAEEPFAAAPAAVPAAPQAAPAAGPAASEAATPLAPAFEVELPPGPFAMEELAPMGGDVFALEAKVAPAAEAGVFEPLPAGEAGAEAVFGPSPAAAAPEPIALPSPPLVAAQPIAAVVPEPVVAAAPEPIALPSPPLVAAQPMAAVAPEPLAAAAPEPAPRPVSPPAAVPPRATVALARLYIQQQDLAGAASMLTRVLERDASNVEARELLALVHDIMEPLPEPLPALSQRERKIAALQRWLASITLAKEEALP